MQGSDKKQYSETISKPSFLVKEKEREIYLNGEVKEIKKIALGKIEKTIKKTMVCFKALEVEENLGREAIRNVLNKEQPPFKFVNTAKSIFDWLYNS